MSYTGRVAEYIIDRLLPGAVRAACDALGFECTAFSDDWVMCVRSRSKQRFVSGYSFDINSQAAALIANDKVAAYQVLHGAQVPAMAHYLVRSEVVTDEYKASLVEALGRGAVVLKPLVGTGGRDIKAFRSVSEALLYASNDPREAWCVSPKVDIVAERRLVILDDSVLLCYEKLEPALEHGIRFYNLGKGAVARQCKPTVEEESLAKCAVRAIGLRLGVVDIVTLGDGVKQIIEVNTGVMMEHFMRQSDEYAQIGVGMYRQIVSAMMEQRKNDGGRSRSATPELRATNVVRSADSLAERRSGVPHPQPQA